MNSPCESCKHFCEEQIEQTLYQAECDEGAPEGVFMSDWGCWRYENVWMEHD